AQLAEIKQKLESVLDDVRRAVEDWPAMRDRVHEVTESLRSNPPPLPAEEIEEGHALLEWMEARHFVFLGYRHYKLTRGQSSDKLTSDPRSGLGILRSAKGERPKSTPLKGEVREHARA